MYQQTETAGDFYPVYHSIQFTAKIVGTSHDTRGFLSTVAETATETSRAVLERKIRNGLRSAKRRMKLRRNAI